MRCRLSIVALMLCALACLQSRVNADEPTTARGYYERGLENERAKRYAEALADFSQAIKLDPKYVDEYFTRIGIYSGHPSEEKRDYAKAVGDLSRILGIEPKQFSSRYNR